MPTKKGYTEQQIAFALKQAELGTPPTEIIRKMGICEQTFLHMEEKICWNGHG